MKNFFVGLFSLSFITTFVISKDHQKYKEIKCTLKPIIRQSGKSNSNLLSRLTVPQIGLGSKLSGSSQNWCGYVSGVNLSAPVLNSVSFVQGRWTVPQVFPANRTTYCAIWVGIDGFNNNTVEQIGTEHEFINGQQFNYAWVEMYPQNAQIISGFPVNVGDIIVGSVRFIGNNTFTLTLVNKTRGIQTKIIKSLANPAQRICAEWIVEAPWLNGILPLSRFSQIHFANCSATIQGVNAAIRSPNRQNIKLNMVNSNGVLKASSSLLSSNGRRFNVNWHHQ